KEELNQLRTGRASTALVENLLVDYYGSKSPLKQIASLSTPEPRLILISPWDKNNLANIEKAIKESQLNLQPNNDGQVVRINIPQLTEERRKDLIKVLNQKAEEAKIAVRKIREEAWEEIQELEKSRKISEDDKFSGKESLQAVIDEYNEKIQALRDVKEKDIMTI
ncbi:ribosome recycling factor, partial [Patescibacteria group bacterium]|nr:ribosome recycling factor [Patescibacteria group bacterium]